jgi:preprotein translocase subunit SecD
VFFSRGLVNLWYGGKKKLKTLAIGQVWRPATAGAYGSSDTGANTAPALPSDSPASAASGKGNGKGKAGRQGKPQLRNRSRESATPRKPGSSR